jgi:hypothetical protein
VQSVIILSVIMLSVVILSVVAPSGKPFMRNQSARVVYAVKKCGQIIAFEMLLVSIVLCSTFLLKTVKSVNIGFSVELQTFSKN